MLGLPKITEMNRPLPKKAIFDKFRPSTSDRKLFDEQIGKMTIIHEISPHTVAVKAGGNISSVYIILIALKTAECSRKNIILLSKLIDQRMVFVLQSGETARLAVHRVDRVLISESRPINDWNLRLSGLDLGAVWDDIIAQIGGVIIAEGSTLDEQIVSDEQYARMI